ncbi:hypothetical protein MMC07_007558 [Pseudocyphellaria aurata]|nr:hypothetical protein [Pseudocyphellaria aurata]
MQTIYTMLGFLALTLASVISRQSRPTPVDLLDRSSTIETVHGPGSGRGLVTETPPAASIFTSSINATTHSPASSAFSSQSSFNLPQQSQLGPGDISNILFGCVASALGAVTVGLTYDSIELEILCSFELLDGDGGGGGLLHEDLAPAYTSVDASAGSLGQQSQ